MSEAGADIRAAYQNALLWAVTGDRAHADKARDIINAWTRSLTVITGADGPLGAGLQGFQLVNAAELLRYTGYDGWSDTDVARCERSLLEVWYPAVSGYALYANGNWDGTAMQTIMGIGVFCELPVLVDDALRFATAGAGNGSVFHRIVTAAGQGQESGRDQGHEQLALGQMANLCQVAWNQGIDLWGFADNRVLANAEYDARFNTGGDVPFVPDLDRTGKYIKTVISDKSRGQHPPIYEMIYAHYASVRGLQAPYTRSVIFRGDNGARVVEGGSDDYPGWGTFSFAEPAAAPAEPQAAPAPPGGVTAIDDGGSITISWLPSAFADAYQVLSAVSPDGPFTPTGPSVDTTTYTDRRRPGSPIYYRVIASNARGSSEPSLPVAAALDLPRPWDSRDVGQIRIPGSAHFDGRRFLLEASGNPESYRLAYLPVSGDCTITTRITWPLSSQYSKTGVFIRAGLERTAPSAAMLVQGLPLHTWSGVWTVRRRSSDPVLATGSTPVPPTQQEAITTNAGFPISDLGSLPDSATPLPAPYVEGAGDGYRLREPYWVRLTRHGQQCTGAISPDGVRWTEVGSTTVTLPVDAYVGLALTSCLGVEESYAETGTGAFDNVSVTTPSRTIWATPAPDTTTSDLRAVTGPDGVQLSWSDPDPGARYEVLRSAANTPATIADSVGPVGFGAFLRYSDGNGVPGTKYQYQVRKINSSGHGPSSSPARVVMPTPAVPQWISSSTAFGNLGRPFLHRLLATHAPGQFTALGLPAGLSIDPATGVISGTPTQEGSFSVSVTAANAGGKASASLQFEIGTPPPAEWTSGDLGDLVVDQREVGTLGVVTVRVPGSSAAQDDAIIVRGAGSGLSVNNQGMTGYFLRQPVTGDYEIRATLAAIDSSASAGQVGLLMAKSLSPFDQAAGLIMTGSSKAQLMLRSTVAGSSAFSSPVTVALPVTLRLRRTGTTFSAACRRSDVDDWTTIAEGVVQQFGTAMYYVGLVVSSGNAGTVGTARFTDVIIDPSGS